MGTRLVVAENYQQDQDGWGFEGGGLVFANDDWACENDGINHVSLSRSTICGNTVEFVPNNILGTYVDPGNNWITDECIFPDLSFDGVVDGADLAIVLGLWGEDCVGCQADLDDNGMIDGADLTQILGAWGAGS